MRAFTEGACSEDYGTFGLLFQVYSHGFHILSDFNSKLDFVIVSEKTGFRHLYRNTVPLHSGTSTGSDDVAREVQLTSGEWEVIGSEVRANLT